MSEEIKIYKNGQWVDAPPNTERIVCRADEYFREPTIEERESINNYLKKISVETGVIWDGILDSAIDSYQNAQANYLKGIARGKEEGMQTTKQEIKDFINASINEKLNKYNTDITCIDMFAAEVLYEIQKWIDNEPKE